MKANDLATVLLVFLGCSGCMANAGIKKIGREEIAQSSDGRHSFSGCLLRDGESGAILVLAPRCEYLSKIEDKSSYLDVVILERAVEDSIRNKKFPMCARVDGQLEKYRYEEDNFLIPSGNLVSRAGIIFPERIVQEKCQ